MNSSKIFWSEDNMVQQDFSLPEPIMEYIAKNPLTPKVYKILIKTCKYFFAKNPILVVSSIRGNVLCDDESCRTTRCNCYGLPHCQDEAHTIGCQRCINYGNQRCMKKVWLSRKTFSGDMKVADIMNFDVYGIHFDQVHITNGDMQLEYVNFFMKKAKKVVLSGVMIYCGQFLALLDDLFGVLPDVTELKISHRGIHIGDADFNNLIRTLRSGQMKYLEIVEINQEVGIHDLWTIVVNKDDNCCIKLIFDNNLRWEEDAYIKEVNEFVKNFIDAGVKNVLVECPNLKEELKKMMEWNQ